jgi:uncharacterized protein (TIGR03086 family)
MPVTDVDRLSQALVATGGLIAAVATDQWSRPTPCSDWDARALANHLVGGHRMFAAIMRGEQLPAPEDLERLRSVDQLGDDVPTAYRAAAAELLAAFSQPGVLERVFESPIGPAPGAALLNLRITESLVHGWDLAVATGQSTATLPDGLAQDALEFSRDRLADLPRGGRFGPAQQAAGDASPIDQLAAYLGRTIATAP